MKEKMVVLLMLILSVSTAVLHGTCEEIQTIIAVVTTKKGPLKIRQEPSRNARELDEIARGTYVTILESGEEWCKVSYGIKTGYAMTCFLTIQENADADVMNYCTLQSGDCGDDVIELKKRLMELGYFRDDSKMTNRYNDTLVGRVKMFQRQNGFEETGIATPDMQVLLFSEDAKVNEEPLPKPPPITGAQARRRRAVRDGKRLSVPAAAARAAIAATKPAISGCLPTRPQNEAKTD